MRWNQKWNLSASAINSKGFMNGSILVVSNEGAQTGKI